MAQAVEPRRKVSDADVVLSECAALESQMAQLRIHYEMYFLGQERRPPTPAHETLKKRIRALRETHIQQTAARFRVDTLDTRFNTYERLWLRNLQEMENGTFRRDVAKMKRKHEAQPPDSLDAGPTEAMNATEALPLGDHVPVATHLGHEAMPTLGAAPAMAPRPAPGGKALVGPATATASGGLSEDRLQALYNAYLSAKKRCNEDVSKLTFENMRASIQKQVPALLTKHNAHSVDFKVVIKDGKAVLRAVPK